MSRLCPGVERLSLNRRGCSSQAEGVSRARYPGDRTVPGGGQPSFKNARMRGRPSNPEGLAPAHSGARSRRHFPELGVITDIALDPVYQPRAGWLDRRQWICAQRRDNRSSASNRRYSHAHGGRRRHRCAVGHDGWPHRCDCGKRWTPTASTSTHASLPTRPNSRASFYGPFRDAVGSSVERSASGNKMTLIRSIPANSATKSLWEVGLDICRKVPTW